MLLSCKSFVNSLAFFSPSSSKSVKTTTSLNFLLFIFSTIENSGFPEIVNIFLKPNFLS